MIVFVIVIVLIAILFICLAFQSPSTPENEQPNEEPQEEEFIEIESKNDLKKKYKNNKNIINVVNYICENFPYLPKNGMSNNERITDRVINITVKLDSIEYSNSYRYTYYEHGQTKNDYRSIGKKWYYMDDFDINEYPDCFILKDVIIEMLIPKLEEKFECKVINCEKKEYYQSTDYYVNKYTGEDTVLQYIKHYNGTFIISFKNPDYKPRSTW